MAIVGRNRPSPRSLLHQSELQRTTVGIVFHFLSRLTKREESTYISSYNGFSAAYTTEIRLLFVTVLLVASTVTAAVAKAQAVDVLCGQPITIGAKPKAVDALFVLRSTVALTSCFPCVCDVDNSGEITASDALAVLKVAVGAQVTFSCASCGQCGDGSVNAPGEDCDSADVAACAEGWCRQDCLCGQVPEQPNFVVIMTDDQNYQTTGFMPQVMDKLWHEGISFENSFVSQPLCGPSRATFFRGQFAHNHNVRVNLPPGGGFDKFRSQGLEESTIATWLQGSGYRTGLIGKYLNRYGESGWDTYVPPGWDHWFAVVSCATGGYYGCTYNRDGDLFQYGDSDANYRTDLEAREALDFLDEATRDERPFFLLIAPFAPHQPATPAPRHRREFEGLIAPRPPSFNEADVSDKPRYLQAFPLLDETQISNLDLLYRKQLRSQLAVDDLVEDVVDKLAALGILDSTYIIFTSDNGFHWGEHRLGPGKTRPYEEDIRVPLIIRGPGVPKGLSRTELVLNVDIAPTIADLAHTKIPSFVDGRSLRPFLAPGVSSEDRLDWREAVLIEQYNGNQPDNPDPPKIWHGIRTVTDKYIRWSNREIELYDLFLDPYELQNIGTTTDPDFLVSLQKWFRALKDCAGETCRIADKYCPGTCLEPTIAFDEVTAAAGITHVGRSWGSAWGDANGDGFIDLWVSNHQDMDSLYENKGDGTFVDVWRDLFENWRNTDTHGAAWADFDNDGDLDLLVEVGAGGGIMSLPNQLYENTAAGFIDRAVELGLDYPLGRGRTPLWLDWDRDGLLDVFLGNDTRPEAPPALFLQRTNGFVNATEELSDKPLGTSQFATLADLSGDRLPELVTHAWRFPQSALDFHRASPEDIKRELNVPIPAYDSYDVAIGDFNGDLRNDMFIVYDRHNSEVNLVHTDKINAALIMPVEHANLRRGFDFVGPESIRVEVVTFPPLANDEIFIGDGGWHPSQSTFELVSTDPSVQGRIDPVPGVDHGFYVSFDLVAQSWRVRLSISPTRIAVGQRANVTISGSSEISDLTRVGIATLEPPGARLFLWHNDRFVDTSLESGFDEPIRCRSVAAADFDNDMDLDLYMVCSDIARNLANRLYLNLGDGQFIEIADAVGASGSDAGVGDVVTVADYDNDGFVDLFVTNGRDLAPFSNDGPDQLFHNTGNTNHWLEIDLVGTSVNSDGMGASVIVTTGGVAQLRETGGCMHNAAMNACRLHFGLANNAVVEQVSVRWPDGSDQNLGPVAADQVLTVVQP